MLNILIRECNNQIIRLLRNVFQTPPNYAESLETIQVRQGSEFIRFNINTGSGVEELEIGWPPGTFYPLDFISYMTNVLVGTEWEGVLNGEYNFATKHFRFYIPSGIITYDITASGLARDVLNLANPVTPGSSLESASAVSYYQGPDEFVLLKWTAELQEGNLPNSANTSKLFIGPQDRWNRVSYPCIIIDVGGGTSKDFNIGDQDVGYVRDSVTGLPSHTKYAGLWQDIPLTVTVMARNADTRDLLMDYLSLLFVFFIRKELARAGLELSSPVSAGGKANFQDADDPREIVYTGTITTNFTSEWEAIIPFRGGIETLIAGKTYLESTPSVPVQGINKIVVHLVTTN